MKLLIGIWVAVLISLVSGVWYFNHVINGLVYDNQLWTQNEPLDWAQAIKSGGLSFGNEKPLIQAQNASKWDLQPFGVGAEDDDTAQLYVAPTQSPIVTFNGRLIQGSK